MCQIIVSGPAAYKNRKVVCQELDSLVVDNKLTPTGVITNGDPGVAQIAKDWARSRSLPTTEYQLLPEHANDPKVKAYRNNRMVLKGDALLVFISDDFGGNGVLGAAKKKQMFTKVVAV